MAEELQSKFPIPLLPMASKPGSASSKQTMRHEPSLAAAEEKRPENWSQSATKLINLNVEPPVAVPNPPPNGGITAWLHVVGGFMLFFNTWGILNAFGAFQTYYESGALFNKSSSDISWIGSIQSFMVLVTGVFAGPIYDRGYLRTLMVVGSFMVVFGHMMLSICSQYWEVLLAQGFCAGIGAGCLFVPCVSVLPTYFSTKIGLAVGIAASGSSFGGVIYPIVLHRLIDQIGFAWAVRAMGFIALGTLLIPICVMKMRLKSPKPRSLVDWTAFTDWPYMVFTIATLIGFIGLNIVFFYLSYYALQQHILNNDMSFYIIAIFNTASIFGRIAPNAISDKVGLFNVLTPGALLTGVLLLTMMAVQNEAAIVILAVLIGFFSGVFIAMPPVCMVALTQDKSLIGTRIGQGYAIIAFGVLTGGPGAGAILGTVEPLDWNGLWSFSGIAACVASLIYAALRVAKFGFSLSLKA
ncbi:hypothetical protein ACMFMG_005287 [Clarireedia jacksonii]